jgi:flagellar biosynthetic protein FliR
MDFVPLNWLLVFLRLSAIMTVFPVFSAANFPVQLRIALGAVAAFLLAPLLPAPPAAGQTFAGVFELMFMEVSVGLLLGFVSRMVFFALDFASALITAQMGLIFMPDVDPLATSASQAPGLVLYFLGVVLLFSLDLHQWLLVAVQRSYVVLPVGGAHLSDSLLKEIIARTGGVFSAGVQLAAPLMAVSFIITLTFAILGRAIPQMNVFSESFALRTLAGLAVFGLTINLMAQQIGSYLRRLPEDFLRVVRLLSAN